MRSKAARLQQQLSQEQATHQRRVEELEAEFHDRMNDRMEKMEDYSDAMYDFRRQAERHLRREIRRIRKKKLPRDREEAAVGKLMEAYEAQVHPQDDLASEQRAAMESALRSSGLGAMMGGGGRLRIQQ
jgi:hypothetical protein